MENIINQLTPKLLILVRGHSGSGKSTFAKKLIQALNQKYGEGSCVHFENDMFLYENDEYIWSPQRVRQAMKSCLHETRVALKNNIKFIIVSNVFGNKNNAEMYQMLANKFGYGNKVFVCSNWGDSLHNVNVKQAIIQYNRVRKSPMIGEEHLPCETGVPKSVADLLDLMVNQPDPNEAFIQENSGLKISQKALDYLELNDKLYTIPSKTQPDFSVLSYRHNVFFSSDWDSLITEFRGLVVDKDNEIIARPFKKVFNDSEFYSNRALGQLDLSDNDRVYAVGKVNGFLGVATYSPKYETVFYSTTGSIDSSFAQLVEKHVGKFASLFKSNPNKSFLFEICDESDPHIIKEELGAYLIGCRDVLTGEMNTENDLDLLAKGRFLRPEHFSCTFGELKEKVKHCKHEGYMVSFTKDGQTQAFKMKSPFYLVSKFLARSTTENLEKKLNKRNFAEEFFPLIDYINENFEQYKALNETERVEFIQSFLGNFGQYKSI